MSKFKQINLFSSNISIQSILQYSIDQWIELNKINVQETNCIESNLMERKEHVVKVLITIFMKYIENPESPHRDSLLSIFEKAFMVAIDEIVSQNYENSMQHLSSYMTQLLVLLNRGMIAFEVVRNLIFKAEDQNQSMIFLENWFDKMSFLMLNFARRISQLAIIHSLPLLTKDMIRFAFPKMAPLVFSAVESDVYINQSKNRKDFYSPDKLEAYETIPMIKNVNAKGSARLTKLRERDKLMKVSLATLFITNMQAM